MQAKDVSQHVDHAILWIYSFVIVEKKEKHGRKQASYLLQPYHSETLPYN